MRIQDRLSQGFVIEPNPAMINIDFVEHVVFKATRTVECSPDRLPDLVVVNVVIKHPGLGVVVRVERGNAENNAGRDAQRTEDGGQIYRRRRAGTIDRKSTRLNSS